MNFSNIAVLLAFDNFAIFTSKEVSAETLGMARKRIAKLIRQSDLKLDFTAEQFEENMYMYLNAETFRNIRSLVFKMYENDNIKEIYTDYHGAPKLMRLVDSMNLDELAAFVLNGKSLNRFKTHFNRESK